MLQARAYKPRCFANRAVKHFEASVPMTSDVVAPAAESAAANGHGEAHSTARFTALLIGSIGVVYGDAVITPALSVLSVIEGIKLVAAAFDAYVVPLTVLILVALFAAQSRGTASVAAFFGPVMCIWFGVIAIAAISPIVQHPEVLLALNPLHAVSFMLHHGIIGFITLVAVFLAVTGAYSLTRQAIQLGLLPRFEIRHTSESHSGQIYIPRINMLLFISVIFLVLMFRSSSALASAYGIAVTGTMVVTAMMGFVVIWRVWRWSPFAAAALIAPFLFLDLTFLAANLLKVFEGGWVPLALGAVVMLLMYTWRRGSRLLFEKSRKLEFPLIELVAMLEKRPPQRVSGTAVFLTSDPASAPTALMHSLKHYKVLHEKNVILTIEIAPTPRIDPAERVRLEQISATFSKVTLRFGFMESPNVPKALAIARKLGWQFDIMSTSFFLSRRALKPAAHSGMPRWQDHLFIALSRTANDATDYFQIPSGRVVEVGTQVTV